MFTQVFIVLLVLLVIYYAALIAMDLYKQKLEADSKKDAVDEVEIDISDEASEFRPTEILREEKKTDIPTKDNSEISPQEKSVNPEEHSDSEEEPKAEKKSVLDQPTEVLTDTLGIIPEDIIKGMNAPNEGSEMQIQPSTALRAPISDDGLTVEGLLEQVEIWSQKGNSELGNIIYECLDRA